METVQIGSEVSYMGYIGDVYYVGNSGFTMNNVTSPEGKGYGREVSVSLRAKFDIIRSPKKVANKVNTKAFNRIARGLLNEKN